MSIEDQVIELFNDSGRIKDMLDWCDGPESDGCIKTDVILAMVSYASEAQIKNIKDWVHQGVKGMDNAFFAGFLSAMPSWGVDVYHTLYSSSEKYLTAINGQ